MELNSIHQLHYAVITSQESAQSHVHVDTVCFCNQSDGAASICLPTQKLQSWD
jgi:hypothetical protein